MTEEESADQPVTSPGLPAHPIRDELLALLAESGTLTSTEAAARLGHSSGLCSFHLRQLARYGHIEEAPSTSGRARPWRLGAAAPPAPAGQPPDALDEFARGLEDESFHSWRRRREEAPEEWRRDEAFSALAYLTPEETAEVSAVLRRALDPYRARESRPELRPERAAPVALVARLFPLLSDDGRGA